MTFDAIDRNRLTEIFEAMDDAAGRDSVKREHQILCVFEAAAILSYGSNARQTQDIDVWRPASRLNDRALRQMAAAAGLDFNPTELEPDRIYLQTVDDGVVRLPHYDRDEAVWSTGRPNEHIWSGNHITIVAPPAEIVAAAKLVGEPQDIEDGKVSRLDNIQPKSEQREELAELILAKFTRGKFKANHNAKAELIADLVAMIQRQNLPVMCDPQAL